MEEYGQHNSMRLNEWNFDILVIHVLRKQANLNMWKAGVNSRTFSRSSLKIQKESIENECNLILVRQFILVGSVSQNRCT